MYTVPLGKYHVYNSFNCRFLYTHLKYVCMFRCTLKNVSSTIYINYSFKSCIVVCGWEVETEVWFPAKIPAREQESCAVLFFMLFDHNLNLNPSKQLSLETRGN